MNKKLFTVLAVALLGIGGVGIWRYQSTFARASSNNASLTGLTKEEIQQILASQMKTDGAGVVTTIENAAKRKAFLNGLREYLSIAAEARKEGLADSSDFKVNLKYKENTLIADLYRAKLSEGLEKPYTVPAEQIEGIWKIDANEEKFGSDMATMQAVQTATFRARGSDFVPTKLQGESLTKARENWARTKILSDQAKADAAFMAGPEIALRFRVLEAGILSSDFLRKHWPDKVRATDPEVASYLASHPEYDLQIKFKKAEAVLQRARSAEDFGKLAVEFSEHRPTRAAGGLMESAKPGEMWPQVEQAALALSPGEIADHLIESEVGYHIVKLEKSSVAKGLENNASSEFTIRHILFQNKFEEPNVLDPNVPPPFMTAIEIARLQIEKEKRNRFVADIVANNPISLPEDFEMGG